MTTSREDGVPLRVLQVSRWLCASGGGGIQTHIAALADALQSHPVSLRYAALMPGTLPGFAADAWLGDAGVPKWINAWRFRRWLARELEDTDLVHIHGVTDWHFLVAAQACRIRGTPYVVTVHGSLFPVAQSLTRVRRIKSELYFRCCPGRLIGGAAVAVASTPVEASAIRRLQNDLDVRICPPAVEVPKTPSLRDASDPSNELRVLFIGRLEPIKSLPLLFQAVALARSRGAHIRLDLIGSGDTEYEERLRRATVELEIANAITWHGYVGGDAKWAVIRRSHVLVLPSFSENFGFTVAEAMAIGLPVIVSEGVGLAETVDSAGAGTVFPVGDAESLAVALAEYVDPRVCRQRGLNAYRTACREFSRETSGRTLHGIYQHVVRREVPASPGSGKGTGCA